MKRVVKTGAEEDAYGRWGRRFLRYIQRPGVRKGIKKTTHKRERKEAQRWITEQTED